MKHRVAIIGSGNWGSAVSKLIGDNVKRHPDVFTADQNVNMWVFEEKVDGKNLTDIINEKHENVKYLPDVKLPDNIVAVSDVKETIKDATALVFVVPHQFIDGICKDLKGLVHPEARAISLVKGVDVHGTHIRIYAKAIQEHLGIPCSALSGANIADEVATEKFCETTIGYENKEDGELWHRLFNTPNFRVSLVDDVNGVSLCGALKNIVAVACGFVDGLGWGSNAKAAIIRIGLMEMKNFSHEFFEGIKDETFTEQSSGVADLITSCIGGRNRKCGAEFVKTRKPFSQIEEELLNGQKLQGVDTAESVHEFLVKKGRVDAYPLFTAVYEIASQGLPPEKLTAKL